MDILLRNGNCKKKLRFLPFVPCDRAERGHGPGPYYWRWFWVLGPRLAYARLAGTTVRGQTPATWPLAKTPKVARSLQHRTQVRSRLEPRLRSSKHNPAT